MDEIPLNLFDRLEGAYAPNTLRAYRSDWAHFLDFCENAGLTPLPASPETMEAFIAFEGQHAVATVERRLYSIRKAHELAGLANPCADIGVSLALRRVRRLKPNRPGQALGVRRDMLEHMIAAQPDTLQGIRNRALLSIGFDFLTRRSELASLRTKDLELQADGTVRGLIRRSKADQFGLGRTVYGSTRSGDLLAKWLEAREVDTPWLFCPVRHGFTYDRPLSTSQVKNIIKAAAKAAGVEGDGTGEVSGHSLRVGAAQELMARGADIGTIMRAGGWKTVDVVARYVQKTEVNIWSNI